MNIALIYHGNIPKEGGTGHVLASLFKSFKNISDDLYFFNPFCKDKNVFKLLELKKYTYKDVLLSLKDKEFLRGFLISIWKIITDKKSSFPDKIKMISYLLIKPTVLLHTIKNFLLISPYIKHLDIDIILGGATSGNILPLIFILSRMFKKKCVSFTYGNDFLVHSKYSLQTYYIRNLDLMFLGAYNIKSLIKKIHPVKESQLKVIRYGLLLQEYEIKETKEDLRKEFNIPLNKFVILSVGRHVSRKNFDLVIKAISHIEKKIPDIDLEYYLIGEGEDTQKLKNLVSNLNLQNKVEFLGFTDVITRNKFFKLSDVFIMPSSIEKESVEGFGIVYIEANYFNCPVIGTFSGGVSEAVLDGETGLLIKEKDLNGLIEKILFLYNNRDKCKEMGFKGHQRVLNEFNWDKIINDYITTFNQLLNGNK